MKQLFSRSVAAAAPSHWAPWRPPAQRTHRYVLQLRCPAGAGVCAAVAADRKFNRLKPSMVWVGHIKESSPAQ